MDNDFYKILTNELPIAYAYHRIICDDKGTPVDYKFLEVNSGFEEYTGLKKEEVIGRTVCQILPQTKTSEFDWIQKYGEVALSGGIMEFEQYSSSLGRWYRVWVTSPEKYYFITFFADVTSENTRTNEHEMLASVEVGFDTKDEAAQDINEVSRNSENNMNKNKNNSSEFLRDQKLQSIIDTLNNIHVKEQVHTERVSKICHYIGVAMNMPPEELKTLEIAGFLHDIGKIVVPNDILNKPDKLTDEEFELIKKHPETGYQILKSVKQYSQAAEYALCHHERWDGKGYPRGLKGEKTPLISHIIAVADAFEAITAGRPYRKARDCQEAISELQKNAGTQFDPQIVDIFVNQVLHSQNNI